MMDQGAKNKYINVQTSFVAVYTDRDGTRVAIESPRCVWSFTVYCRLEDVTLMLCYLKLFGLGRLWTNIYIEQARFHGGSSNFHL